MSVKDKIIFGVLLVLIGVAGYFQYMATNMIARMDELNKNDSEHVDVVHNEFREDLRKLNLQFIGRGKHLQKAQQDIIANTKYIEYVTDSLGNAIQVVQYNLDELDRTVSKQFANVEDDIQDLTDSFNRERRRSKSERTEIKQTITVMQSEIKVLNDKVFGVPEEEKEKKK
jgi:gas vesicle protein|tara:strand:- start:293 stop:805 length:513 start_codon:yes stop_codon:yes gene_type:complete